MADEYTIPLLWRPDIRRGFLIKAIDARKTIAEYNAAGGGILEAYKRAEDMVPGLGMECTDDVSGAFMGGDPVGTSVCGTVVIEDGPAVAEAWLVIAPLSCAVEGLMATFVKGVRILVQVKF